MSLCSDVHAQSQIQYASFRVQERFSKGTWKLDVKKSNISPLPSNHFQSTLRMFTDFGSSAPTSDRFTFPDPDSNSDSYLDYKPNGNILLFTASLYCTESNLDSNPNFLEQELDRNRNPDLRMQISLNKGIGCRFWSAIIHITIYIIIFPK